MKEGWEYKKLGEVAFYSTNRIPSSSIDEKNYVGVDNLLKDRKGKIPSTVVPTEGNCISYESGDILVGNIRPYLKKIWLANSDGGASGDVLVIRTNNHQKLQSNFLYWVLANDTFFQYNMLHSKGAKMPRGNKVDILKYIVPIPSLSEQQHIVEELDLLCSIIEKKKAQLNELDNLAQSLFYEMFGDNADCSTKKIKDIAIVKIGPFGSSLHKSDYVSGGTPLINPIHMSEGKILPDENFTITNEKKKELETYLLQTNDIIFGRRGDIGRCALVTRKENGYLCGTGSLFVRFQVNINPIYCINYLSTRFVKDYLVQNAKGATMLNLNSKIIENVPMLFPSLDLQNQFASKIEAIEHQKELTKQSIKEVETLFNSRMDYYFN